MFRWFLFYPLTALVAAAVVLASFGPALIPTDERTASGRISQNTLVLEGGDLAHPRTDQNIVFYVPRDVRWQATGLRVAVRPGAGPVDAREQGLQILLAPRTSAWLGDGPLRVEVNTSPLPLTAASQFALGLTRGAGTEWRARPISAIRGVVVYEFAADAGGAPVRSLALRPISADPGGNRGVEIRSIRVVRLGAS